MAKYSFDIDKHRSDIESGKLKLVSGYKNESEVVVLDWEFDKYYPVVAKVKAPAGNWVIRKYTAHGEENEAYCHEHLYDLFVIDDDIDLTEVKKCLGEFYDNASFTPDRDKDFKGMINAYATRIYNIVKSDIANRFILVKLKDMMQKSPEDNLSDIEYSRGYKAGVSAGMNNCRVVVNSKDAYNLGKQHVLKEIHKRYAELYSHYLGKKPTELDGRIVLDCIGAKIKELEDEKD